MSNAARGAGKCRLAITLACLVLATAHNGLSINPQLGVPGYADCWQPGRLKLVAPGGAWQGQLEYGGPWKDAHLTLKCGQRSKDFDAQLSVGCIGDSITAGVHAAGFPGNKSLTYPSQLQDMLGSQYKVCNISVLVQI
jgi:hypothetical protein